MHQGGPDALSEQHLERHIHPRTPDNRQLPACMQGAAAAVVIRKPLCGNRSRRQGTLQEPVLYQYLPGRDQLGAGQVVSAGRLVNLRY